MLTEIEMIELASLSWSVRILDSKTLVRLEYLNKLKRDYNIYYFISRLCRLKVNADEILSMSHEERITYLYLFESS